MKRILCFAGLTLCLCLLAGCSGERNTWIQLENGRSYLDNRGKPVTGWYEIQGERYFFDENGLLASGWQEADGSRFYIDPDGTLASGWRMLDETLCYLDDRGQLCSGWAEVGGQRCYFSPQGTPVSGWTKIDGKTYYLNANGVPATGWLELDGKRYFFEETGVMRTGWVEYEQETYYFFPDGTMAVGEVTIDGQRCHFSPHGVRVILVNPWNPLPADLNVEVIHVDDYYRISTECYDALMQMMADCAAAGHKPKLRSAYRTMTDQTYLHENKVNYYLDRGYDREEAGRRAAQVVAYPGTSEHQLGLAVDLVDEVFQDLTTRQEKTATQKWFMEHCWEYGFILRYPNGTTSITGIIYEPWHYRYVGVKIAMELKDSGLTLEEYLGATQS